MMGNIPEYANYVNTFTAATTAVTTAAASFGSIVATAATLDIPGIATAVAREALKAATDQVLSPLGAGLYVLPVYPRNIDLQRVQLETEIGELTAILDDLRNAAGAPSGYKVSLSAATKKLAKDMSFQYFQAGVSAETREAVVERALADQATVASVTSALAQRIARLKETLSQMADPGIPTSFTYGDFVDAVALSFDDPLDPRRPKFDSATVVGGGIVIVHADRIEDFMQALQRLARFFRARKMERYCAASSRVLNGDVGVRPIDTLGIGRPPNWWSWTLARLIGIDKDVDRIRNAAYTLLPNRTVSNKYAEYLTRTAAAVTETITAANDLATLITTLATPDVGAAVLPILPVEGTKQVTLFGETYTLPNATYGNAGFVNALRSASDPPQSRFVAGVVIYVPSPVPGLINFLSDDLKNAPSFDVQALFNNLTSASQAQAIVGLINQAVTVCQTQLGVIKSLTNAV